MEFESDTVTIAEGGSEALGVNVSCPGAGWSRSLAQSVTGSGDVSAQLGMFWDTVDFTAADDEAALDDEAVYTLNVTCTRAGGPDAVAAASVTVTITDEDTPAVSVEYGSATYTVAESDDDTAADRRENEVEVTVTLSADPERTVTIPLTKTNQDGAGDADYSGVPENVVFYSGKTAKSFTFTVTGDEADDDGESVRLGFGTLPHGVSAGTIGETTVGITDDDGNDDS